MKKYKQILREHKKLFKDIYSKVSNPNATKFENTQTTINFISKNISNLLNTNPRESHYQAIAIKGLIDEMNGSLIHYFISDKSLISFLKTTEIKDTSIVKDFVLEKSNGLGSTTSRYFTLALHTEDDGYLIDYLCNTEGKYIVVIFENDHCVSCNLDGNIQLNELTNMAVNLIYYMKAFPEKILDGVPDDMVKADKKEKYGNCENYSIGIADEIVEKTEVVNGHIVTPHYRRGFFRHYRNDCYVNMKGKVVFIAATMVKGKAKTVIA